MKKKTYKKKSNEERNAQKERLKELLSDTQSGIWMECSTLVNFLRFAAKFKQYSYNNQCMVYAQRPNATAVKTFQGWKELGRFVKKGEKGIEIFAPFQRSHTQKKDVLDEQGNRKLDKDGNPIKEDAVIQFTDYMVKYVYDISQTEGDPVPELASMSEDPVFETDGDLSDALAKAVPGFTPTGGPASDQILAASAGYLMGNGGFSDTSEAAALAFVLTSYLQLELPGGLASEVFGWAKGKEAKEISSFMSKIQKAAKDMLSRMELEVAA